MRSVTVSTQRYRVYILIQLGYLVCSSHHVVMKSFDCSDEPRHTADGFSSLKSVCGPKHRKE